MKLIKDATMKQRMSQVPSSRHPSGVTASIKHLLLILEDPSRQMMQAQTFFFLRTLLKFSTEHSLWSCFG